MLSSSSSATLLSTVLHRPPKSLKPFSYCLPTSKKPVLIGGFISKSPLLGRFRVSGPRNMAELSSVDAFGSSNGAERDVMGEAEAILGNGSSRFGPFSSWEEFESALNEMSKWLVVGLFGIIILWKHDAETMWAAMGSVVNSCLSISLKHILNHQRPVSALRYGPGMPSSHAQSIFYTSAFAILLMVHWLGINVFTVVVGTFTLAFGSYLSWLRVTQQFHTISQVLVGAALGSTCGVSWFWLWHAFVLKAFLSSIWVRIIVVLGSATFCVVFLIYVIRHWLIHEQ